MRCKQYEWVKCCLTVVSRKENKHSQLPANKRGLVRLGQVPVDPTGHPQGRYLHVEGRGTSVVSAVLPVLQTSPPSTTRAANVPRSTTSPLASPRQPSSIRIIADWKNKLRRGSRQFEETGRLLLNHRLSGPFDYHLLACGYVISSPVLPRRWSACARPRGKPYRKSFNTAGMSAPFHSNTLLETSLSHHHLCCIYMKIWVTEKM